MTLTLAAPAGADDMPPTSFPRGHSVPPQASVMLAAFTAALDADTHPLLIAGQALAREHRFYAEARQKLISSRSASALVPHSAVDPLLCRVEIRAAWVEKVDSWARAHFPRAPRARLHTSTFGEIVDQLAHAWAAVEHSGPDVGELDATRMKQRLADLTEAYDDTVPLLVGGQLRTPLVSAITTPYPSL